MTYFVKRNIPPLFWIIIYSKAISQMKQAKIGMHNHGAELATLLAEDLKGNFSLFVSHYQTRLYAFMLFRSGSSHEAEDIAQEAFIQAYYAMADYPPARIQALAFTIGGEVGTGIMQVWQE